MIRVLQPLAVVALVAASVAAHASELESARKDAEAGTRALEQRPCPALGNRSYIRGLSDAQQLVAAADRERAYVDGALRQLQQIGSDPKLAPEQRRNLQALASWSIAASMANWSMLQVAQQALANPLVENGRPHPAGLIEGARDRLSAIGGNPSMSADAASVVRRQTAALERCSGTFLAEIFKLNQPQLEAAIEGAGSTADLNRLEQVYRTRDAVTGGYGADSLDKLAMRRASIAEAERVARERAAVASAEEAARRQAEAEKRQAELNARLSGYLVVAKRFADATRNGNERAALAELSRDVVMSTPNGTYRGIDEVAGAVRQQSSSGQSGSLGTPQIAGDRIIAIGSTSGIRITTTFGFDTSNRISRLDISL
jgi:hypothetical protein